MTSRPAGIFACLFFFTLAVQAAPRVALMDFSSDDNSYRSYVAAKDFSALLQAQLENSPDYDWVERNQLEAAENELNMAANGYVSPSAALHVGKLLKADFLINGQFSATDGRTLHLEVIDLQHADVLAEMSLPIDGPTNEPLVVAAKNVSNAGAHIPSLLQQALVRSAQTKGDLIVAPLFFANTSRSRRLDDWEDELQSALSSAASVPAAKVRVLQFPRANTATGEQILILAGLAEQDPDAWQKVADLYVWGQYEEVNPDQFAFEQTPVKFTLNSWNGSGDVQTITETTTVSGFPQLKAQIIQQILTAARSPKTQISSEKTRNQLANQLLQRANDLQPLFRTETLGFHSPSLLDTPEGQQLRRYQFRLLTIAHFFAPEPGPISDTWFGYAWSGPLTFWQQMDQLHSYDDYDDAFGLIPPGATSVDTSIESHWRTMAGKIGGVIEYAYSDDKESLHEEIEKTSNPYIDQPGFPADAPKEVLMAWRAQILNDTALRLFHMCEAANAATPPVADLDAQSILNSGLPSYLDDPQLKPRFFRDLQKEVIPVATVSDQPPYYWHEAANAKHKKIIGVNTLPPKFSPGLRYVPFPDNSEANGVVALNYSAHVLWASTRGGGMTMSDPFWEFLVSPHTNAALWRLSSDESMPDLISPHLGKHSKITSFSAVDGQLWMTSDHDGVFQLNSSDLSVVHYGSQQGVLSQQTFASTLMDHRLFIGGGEPFNGQLNYLDFPNPSWKSQSLSDGLQIKLLQPYRHYLLVNNQILDRNNGSWTAIRDFLPNPNLDRPTAILQPPHFDVLSAASDSNQLWLGTTFGLMGCDPDSGAKQFHFSDIGGYFVDNKGAPLSTTPPARIPGAVTALAEDGDFLWVATSTRLDPSLNGNGHTSKWIDDHLVLTSLDADTGFARGDGDWRNMYVEREKDYVMLLHKQTGKWVGYFPVPNRVTSLAVSSDKLWIGLEDSGYLKFGEDAADVQELFEPSPLIEVAKSALLSTPPAQWVSDEPSADELAARTRDAVQVLNSIPPPSSIPSDALSDDDSVTRDRKEFLHQIFSQFPLFQLRKDTNGEALLQYVHVRDQMFEHAGLYYFGFRLTMPPWADGNPQWIYALAKTKTNKDFLSQTYWSGIVSQNGPIQAIDLDREPLTNYPALHQKLPYSFYLTIQTESMDNLTPGQTYAFWFCVHEPDFPDIALAMTLSSSRGTYEFGSLPMH